MLYFYQFFLFFVKILKYCFDSLITDRVVTVWYFNQLSYIRQFKQNIIKNHFLSFDWRECSQCKTDVKIEEMKSSRKRKRSFDQNLRFWKQSKGFWKQNNVFWQGLCFPNFLLCKKRLVQSLFKKTSFHSFENKILFENISSFRFLKHKVSRVYNFDKEGSN